MLLLKFFATTLLFLVIAAALAITIVPRFLDRIYYEGPESDHFDGQRFFNPDGDEDTARPPTGGSRTGFLWRQATGSDGRPAWPDSVPVTPGKPEARVEGDRLIATWIGHATVLLQTQGLNILTDPVYADRAGPLGFGPKRTTAPGVRFEDLPKIDVVLISHNHYDHMDLKTLKRLWDRDKPVIVTSLGNDSILRGAGIPVRDMGDECFTGGGVEALDWGNHTEVGGRGPPPEGAPSDWCGAGHATVWVTRNHHWGSRWFTDRNRALWSSFVITLPSGGNIFFAGDTGLGDGNWPAEAAALGPIRLALIPIGAFRFVPGQMASGSHIGPIDAVRVFDRLGAARAIPIHWGTFRLSYEARDTPPKMLEALLRRTGGDPAAFGAVELGRAVEVPSYVAPVRRPDEAKLRGAGDWPEIEALS